MSDRRVPAAILVAALLVGAALMMPAAPGGNSAPVDPNEGSVTTPRPTATPDQQPSLERDRPDLSSARLASIPESHATATASDGPPVPDSVSASAGAQTMRVETTAVDGEPALQLSDDSQHEGRWVSIETQWLRDNLGTVPDTVTVAHESNGTYVSDLRVRDDSAAFYVEGFSTNVVTFGGEVSATGSYTDGSSFGYDITDLDAASDFSIDATGVTASEWDNETASGLANGDVLDLAIAGTQVTDQSITLTGEETTSSGSASASDVTDGSSTTTGISTDAEEIRGGSVTFSGRETTTANDQSGSVSSADALSVTPGGNVAPTGPNGSPSLTLSNTETTATYNPMASRGLSRESYGYSIAGAGPDSSPIGAELHFNPDTSGELTTIAPYIASAEGSDYGASADIYISEGPPDETDSGLLTPDGTLVKSNWDPDWTTGQQQIDLDTSYSVSAGQDYTVEIITDSGSADSYQRIKIGMGSEGSDIMTYSSWQGSHISTTNPLDLDVDIKPPVRDLTVTADDAAGTSVSVGDIATGGSATVDIPFGVDTTQLDVSGSPGVTLDWSLDMDSVTATDSPGLDTDGDGTTDVSHSGILTSGETATVSIPDADLDPSTSSVATTLAGGSTDWTLDWTRVDHSEDPTVTLPDGSVIASHDGLLAPGETTTTQLNDALTTSTDSLDIETTGGTTVGATASIRELSPTQDLTLSINGNEVSHDGIIADGETVSLATNTSWLQSGTNTVDVSVADTGPDAPTPQVALDYSHSLTDRVSVNYQGEAFSERYNVSRSYASERSNATLTIPHAAEVLSIRNLEYQVDGGGWQQMPEGAATLDNTTLSVNMSALAGEPIPESTTIDIRSTASKVQVDGGEISVLQPTAVGFDLNSRIRLESWSDGASIALGGTPQGSLVHYATDESYSEEDDYAVIDADGSQRLYLPAGTDGSELSIKTLPVEASPETNTMELRVPDDANATNIEMVVSGGPVVGDSWTARYVGGTEGSYYAVVGENGDRLARAQAPDAMTVSRDDVGQVSIESAQPPSEDEPANAGAALFSTLGGPTFLPLLIIFGGIGGIALAGRRPEQSRDTIAGLADSIGGLISAVPRIGPAIASPVEDLVTGIGDAAVSIGESEIAVGGIAVIATVAAEQANLFSVGPQTAAIGAIGAVAVGSLIALRRTDSFSIQLWGSIVGATTLVALQTLGETDLIGAVVNSDAFLFVALGGLYLAYRAISAWQASEQAENAPPEITIDASSLRGGDGGDDQ